MSDQQTAHKLRTNSKEREKSLVWPTARLGPHLRGLTLLLKLLQLLGSEETHRFIASNELRTCWHGGKDDIAAQPAEAVEGEQE